MIPSRPTSAARPTSRALRLLDAVVDDDGGDNLPPDDPARGDNGEVSDALADLDQRLAAVETALRRAQLYPPDGPGQPTADPAKPAKPSSSPDR